MNARFAALKTRHANLETSIESLEGAPLVDTVAVSALKRDKLRIKEEMTRIESEEHA